MVETSTGRTPDPPEADVAPAVHVPPGAARHAALDWLRAAATLAIFVFHGGAPYVAGDWHISSQTKSYALTVWNAGLLVWAMPLFFVLSGVSLELALRARAARRVAAERLRRLLVPLVFGILVVVPPQVYLERLSRGQFDGSFLAFYPRYFNAPYLEIGGTGNFAWMGLHLWYLLMLLLLSLAGLPLFLMLRRHAQAPAMRRLDGFLARPGALLVLAVPIALVEWPLGNVGLGGWNMLTYPLFFTYGFVLARSPSGLAAVAETAPAALVVALAATAVLLWSVYGAGPVPYGRYDPEWLAVPHALAGWCWTLALVGLASRRLDGRHAMPRRLAEALLPVYVLHQTVIVAAAYAVEPMPLGVWGKYAIVLLSSASTTALGIAVVRRFAPTRGLFGMKPA